MSGHGDGRPRAAVIGSGVAGLTAAYALRQRYEVTLVEADRRLGGHAHTHEVETPDAGVLRVDSGFIVHNRVTYPNLVRLFRELGVETQPTGMSMSVRCDGCGLEYAGAKGPGGVFASARSLARPAFLRMLAEISRFHGHARRVVRSLDDGTTLGAFLGAGGYSRYFVAHFMVPTVSAVWSCAPQTALEYPARYLFSFLDNHGLLSVRGSHQWYTVAGGSRTYVDAIAKNLQRIRTGAPVRAVERHPGGVDLVFEGGARETFERAVIATHPDTALGMLARPTREQSEVLGAFTYSRNETVLHHDPTVLPRRRRARAAWNYRLADCGTGADAVLVTYDMNRLQLLATRAPQLVSLNAGGALDPGAVAARMVYEHPVYTPRSVAAQSRLPDLNDGVLAFAGAYHGWGFHEDGCRSGLSAARSLGADW